MNGEWGPFMHGEGYPEDECSAGFGEEGNEGRSTDGSCPGGVWDIAWDDGREGVWHCQ